MALPERVYKFTDRPMTWTRAIVTGLVIWVIAILLLGQLPSWIIYKADQSVSSLIEFSTKIPLVNDEGLNPKQIEMIRDVVANGVQMGALVAMLVVAYFWQERKRKRTGGKGVQDVVKGYMPGK
jgi:xanthine/uracil permease